MSEATQPYQLAAEAALALRQRLPQVPAAVVVLGSGWGDAERHFGEVAMEIATDSLPGFPAPTAPGHTGAVRAHRLGQRLILVLSGRVHLYEGHSAATVVHGVRAAVLAGARVVVLCNAAGALRTDLPVGRVTAIADHLNLTGTSPLLGALPPPPHAGRFLEVASLYDRELRRRLREIEPSIREVTYAGVLGPQFETPAEVLMLAGMGADLVGMSTVLEAIAAHHLGARVLGLSLVTNLAAGLSPQPVNADEVLEVGRASASELGRLLVEFLTQPGVTAELA
ncbi:MAG: purine-nucleoside phosphorylase [Candidatus Dormibacteria bacterium]